MAEEENEFAAVAGEFKKFKEEMKNPLVVGALLSRLSEERSATNLVLKEINAKLDRLLALETRMAALEQKFSHPTKPAEVMLPEIDEEIVSFVASQKKACAEEVQKHFNYKGRNAASSRLNRLVQLGALAKTQVGKKVYFTVATPTKRE
ncbi:MAG: hypothetical protein AB1626_05200 [Candidatus Micrarchaeota archaeon]